MKSNAPPVNTETASKGAQVSFWTLFMLITYHQHGLSFSAEKTWADLANNIREIQNHDASNLSFEENYRFAYNMVLYKEGKMLYEGVKKLVAENLDILARDKVIPAFPTRAISDPIHQTQEEDVFLKALRSIWDDHTGNMTKLGQILKYMVRNLTTLLQSCLTRNLRIEFTPRLRTSQRYMRQGSIFSSNTSSDRQYNNTS